MSRRPLFLPNRHRASRGDSYVPSRDNSRQPLQSEREYERGYDRAADRPRDRDRYFSQSKDHYKGSRRDNIPSPARTPPQASREIGKSGDSAPPLSTALPMQQRDSTRASDEPPPPQEQLPTPEASKWSCGTAESVLSRWSTQKHFLRDGKLSDPDAISLFHKASIHAVYDPDIKKDESKGKTIIYKSYSRGAVPKTKDPRVQYFRSRQLPKTLKKIPFKTLSSTSFIYDKNSIGPAPPCEAIISGLGNMWNEAYLRNQVKTFGELLEYDNVLDPSTGMLLGIIRVKFGGSVDRANRSVMKAISELNKTQFEGKTLRVLVMKDEKTLESVKRKEMSKRLAGHKSHDKTKKAVLPPAPRAHRDAIARREIRSGIKFGSKPDEQTHIAQPPVTNRKQFVVPREIMKHVKDKTFLFIDSKITAPRIIADDLKKHLRLYDWTKVLPDPKGIFVIFNTQNEARRCLRSENGKFLRGVKLDFSLHSQEDCIGEKPEPVVIHTDPLEEATLQLTKELEMALQKDIRSKIIAPAVLEFLNQDNFPELKAKLEIAQQRALPIQAKPIMKQESNNITKHQPPVSIVKAETLMKLPSFKRKIDPLKDLKKKRKIQKLDIKAVKANSENIDEFDDDDDDDDDDDSSPIGTPMTPDVESPPKKKQKKNNEPLLFSSSDEEEEEEEVTDEVKDSIPTTPEALQQDRIDIDGDVNMMAKEDVNITDGIETVGKGIYAPTATELPVPVFEEKNVQTLDFEGMSNFLMDDEDFELMRLALKDNSKTPIKGSLGYWAWKHKKLKAMNKVLTIDVPPFGLQNSTGSQRSQGYVKIPDSVKVEYLPHRKRVHDPLATVQVDNEDGEQAKAQSSRTNRSNNRRFAYEVSNFNTDNEILKLNQLNKRKKPVSFARSAIHNWGLYALGPIAEKEMIIEYVGERLRQQVADAREKTYLKSGVGSSYLFRVDADTVIDATKKGGIARFINHCCVPSCTAKIIKVDGQKRIVIYALRDIGANEELTYDYKFERDENENERVRCLCGAPGCKGYLN